MQALFSRAWQVAGFRVPAEPPIPAWLALGSTAVDNRREVRDFLVSRRAKIPPDRAGLAAYGSNRRVPGLRREEVAMLAGVSVDYYTRLEKGNLAGVSDTVLDAVARALHLDDVERAHLFDLARTANATPMRTPRRAGRQPQVRPSVQRLLDAMTWVAAFLRTGRLDVLAANQLGYALYAPVFSRGGRPVNLARYVFLDPRAKDFYADWDGIAAAAVGSLRAEAGRDPYDRALSSLIGDLSVRSEEFRVRWAAHDVTEYRSGTQPFRHPLVGDLTLDYTALDLPADPGQVIVAYTAEPDSPAQDALAFLASWAVSDSQPDVATTADIQDNPAGP
jgi:transcriptional regulator with XRE-family HTH domain